MYILSFKNAVQPAWVLKASLCVCLVFVWWYLAFYG